MFQPISDRFAEKVGEVGRGRVSYRIDKKSKSIQPHTAPTSKADRLLLDRRGCIVLYYSRCSQPTLQERYEDIRGQPLHALTQPFFVLVTLVAAMRLYGMISFPTLHSLYFPFFLVGTGGKCRLLRPLSPIQLKPSKRYVSCYVVS